MLVVIAEEEELTLVKKLGYDKYPVLITGVGAMNVINALKDLPKDTEIMNIGYAGSNTHEIGSIIHIYGVKTYHEKADFEEKVKFLEFKTLPEYDDVTMCYTSTDFVTKTNIKEPCVFDMELAYIRSLFNNTKSIKVVSDNLNKKQYKESVK